MNASSNNSTPDQSIAQRIAAVREQMAAACARSGRFPDAVTLIAVSKTHPAAAVMEAVTVGVRDFGENRVEEAGKIAVVTAEYGAVPLTWHMIGHVQSRKAGDILPHYRWIHSLDSVKLAERFARLLRDDQGVANVVSVRPIDALIEINISGEASKDGFAASHWQHDADQRNTLWAAIRQMSALHDAGLHLRGLMTIAPVATDPEQVRPVFAGLRALRDALASDFPQGDWQTLSMGMTDDYPVAIEEGATLIRVGRAIFGTRIV